MMSKKELQDRVAAYITRHPELSYAAIAATLGVSRGTIVKIADEYGIRRPCGRYPKHLSQKLNLAVLDA